MTEVIQNAYAAFEQLNVSVTGLIVAVLVFSLALLFAIREAASWFFKIDDIKRDVKRMHDLTIQLEGEVKLIQNLLMQAHQVRVTERATERATAVVEPVAMQKTAQASPAVASNPASEKPPGGFPIVH